MRVKISSEARRSFSIRAAASGDRSGKAAIEERKMCNGKSTLDETDFPLKVEKSRIKTKHDIPVATAANEKVAQEIAARLNQCAWCDLDNKWNL